MQVVTVAAFMQDGCGAGSCRNCHQLNTTEAAALLTVAEEQILELKMSEVPGLWEIDIRLPQQVMPVFIDFSKQYLISGSVIKIADRRDITRQRLTDLNRRDVTRIPLQDALVVGNPTAGHRIIVFDDPQCSYCGKLHQEMKRVVEKRPDIAFYIKMFPLASHPQAYERAKAIVCSGSLAMLEASLAGEVINQATCETDAIDKNLELAASLGIRSTPTLIFPDGRVVPGYKTMENMIDLLEKPVTNAGNTP
jgi:thiol:disulfide interchange protein DsbC